MGLIWTAVSGATSYEVFCAGVPVATTTSPNYTETGLTNGTTYPFAVEATNGGGTSPASSTASATPEPAAPAAPTGLVATAGNAQVALTWTAVSGATSYTVLENGTAVTTTTSASATVTGLTNGTTYSFTVEATNGGGSSAQSSAVVATPVASTPAAPTGRGRRGDGGRCDTHLDSFHRGHRIHGLRQRRAVATSTTSTAVVTDLQAGTPEVYVTASGPGGTSVPGGAVPIVTTPGSPRLTVQNFVATLTFTGDTGAGGPSWTVLDNGVPMQGVTFVANGSTVRAVVRNLAQGTAYDFSVRLIGGAVSPPTAPLGFLTRSIPTITTSGTVQTLTWGTATTGMSWKVEGCSSTTGMCTGVTPVTTGPMTQTGDGEHHRLGVLTDPLLPLPRPSSRTWPPTPRGPDSWYRPVRADPGRGPVPVTGDPDDLIRRRPGPRRWGRRVPDGTEQFPGHPVRGAVDDVRSRRVA